MRVDVPTLRCDRCGHETQDLAEMASFYQLTHYHTSGRDEWDLCSSCRGEFHHGFLAQTPETAPPQRPRNAEQHEGGGTAPTGGPGASMKYGSEVE